MPFASETGSEYDDLPSVYSPPPDQVAQEKKGFVETFFGWFRGPQGNKSIETVAVTVSDEDDQKMELAKFDYPSDIPQN